ncbi:hypothetical protein MARPU_01150 [Marichromatium purpuratum 984]|uniref:Zinc finger CHCC-type domain-containing protein n=1 Tax=Marichromatium purpuratum 984 TaxID=765910 RepID=W0E055_MARPU|nr:zinc-finger domain-containing protein [Marichromatium purpuratum]AHF02619.1 hypothetical protein MARPU_01150 [Marichromatium purpuratum 984]
MANPAIRQPQQEAPIAVTRAQLPLACPRPETPVWDLHPRVYLPIADAPDGRVTCPYCGASYQLVD